MSTLPTYSFLPWLRQGVANKITAQDHAQDVKLRASVQVQLTLAGDGLDAALTQTVSRAVELYGPGDIIGMESRAIIRNDPRHWITNFEPNYLPAIEFYDEDFPWRYTPAAPDGTRTRLRPWIMLLVLEESEFEEGQNIKDRPLPFVTIKNMSAFPPADQLWAWAHVHVNRSLSPDGGVISTDMGAVIPKFQAVLAENPDLAYSRLLSPRRLKANTPYHAFVIPVFESGRLAGLGLDPGQAPYATLAGWEAYPGGAPAKAEATSYPFYFRWYFRTGELGDFEYLVRLLKPLPVDKRVGRRDLDVQAPGANLPGIDQPDPGGILKLGGALRVPLADLKPDELAEVNQYEHWYEPFPSPFQVALATLINLSDDYSQKNPGDANQAAAQNSDLEIDENDPDPLITPPLYGRWPALATRLLTDRSGASLNRQPQWIHDLNLNPVYRVPAGFGTRVVQDQQETYMNAAWEQIGQVLEANQRLRLAQLGLQVSRAWFDRQVVPLQAARPAQVLLLTAPVQKRVVNGGFTIAHQVSASTVTAALPSAAMRRMLRPGGRLAKSLPFPSKTPLASLLPRLNAGEVTAAPPKTAPAGIPTLQNVADALQPQGIPGWIERRLRQNPNLPRTFLLAGLVLLVVVACGLFPVGLLLAPAPAVGLYFAYRQLRQWAQSIQQADVALEAQQTPAAVDRLPKSPDFHLSEPGAGFTPAAGAQDSPEAARFKDALRDTGALLAATAAASQKTPRRPLNLAQVAAAAVQGINPQKVIPQRTWQTLQIPARIRQNLTAGLDLRPVMAYPEIDVPMYRPLTDLSSELFLPNINLIENNSITLLETNQPFIEAYMVGLNHEFARELLWREYPTDQRGSYFRQFWDVSSFFAGASLTPDQQKALREQLRDIPPLHRWQPGSLLGEHDQREAGGQKADIVLVIRGELLKKYPTAVIYAQAAQWQLKNGQIDRTKPRDLVALTAVEEDNPPRDKVKTPLYQAQVLPDIYFFGFDLTAEEARGGSGEHPNDPPGWFFVIKERPGEPRFGLDDAPAGALHTWNDLTWNHVLPAGAPFLEVKPGMPTPALSAPGAGDPPEITPQYNEDKHVAWNASASAADLAYILYQAPVMIAIHAAEMLAPAS